MNTFTRGLGSAVAALLCSLCAAAQPASTPAKATSLPTAEEIFERHIEAIGGREKLNQIYNRRISGSYKGKPFEFTAKLEVWWEKDGRFHQRVSEPGGLRYDLYVNGTTTWAEVMGNEPVPIFGMQRVELLDTADFMGEANYKNRYKQIKTAGSGAADGTPVWIVSAVTHSGRPHSLFFDKETGLLMGTKVPTSGEGGVIRDMMVKVLDYKDTGGVLYPTRVLQQFTNGEGVNEYRYTSIEVNVDDGHTYEIPESIKTAFEEAAQAEQQADTEGEG